MFASSSSAVYFPDTSTERGMADSLWRRARVVPNVRSNADIDLLLEQVCARLRNDYARQLVRDVVRLKLEMGFDNDVRDYLRRRSGEHRAVRKE
jgi:hypothetical protein